MPFTPNPAPATKWSILQMHMEEAWREFDRIRRNLNWMEHASFGKPCSGCQELLETEADFARHFIVRDPRFLNLGDCPNIPKESPNA